MVYRAYVPYLGKNAIMCWGDGVRGPVQLFLPLSPSVNTANYGWTLSASCWIEANKSEPWKVDRAVGTICACASAYGRRDAPSPVGLDLSVSCVRDACRLRASLVSRPSRRKEGLVSTACACAK